jgi:hypothetical protein
MHFKNQEGNIIMEYVVYILVCIIIFQGIINFLQITIQRNEMAKISNFISFSIAQDPKKLSIFTPKNQQEWLLVLSPNLKLDYSIYCGQETCSTSSNFVQISLESSFEYLMFKIPLKVTSKYQMGKYLSKV